MRLNTSDVSAFFQNVFINELEEGDRSKAMNRLRVPPLTEREVSVILFRMIFQDVVIFLPVSIFFKISSKRLKVH